MNDALVANSSSHPSPALGVNKRYRTPVIMIASCLLLLSIEIILGIAGISIALFARGSLPYQFQLANTIVSLILTICETATISHCIRALILAKESETSRKRSLARQDSMEEECEESQEKLIEVIDRIDNMALTNWKETEFRALSWSSTLALFVSLTGLNLAFMLICWGMTIASVFYHVAVTSILYFITTDLVLGIVCPILVVFSVLMMVTVVQFITYNKVVIEEIAPIFLSFLSYKGGEKFCYWVIIDTFYFRVKKTLSNSQVLHEHHNASGISMTRNPSTWCIVIIICITFIMVVSVFVSETITKVTCYNDCQDAVRNGEESCFVRSSYDHINCSEPSSLLNTDIVCFQFLLIGISSDLVKGLVDALFLYIACDKLLTMLFHLVKGLLSVKKTACWAILVLGTGVTLILIHIVQFAISFLLTYEFDLLKTIRYFVLSCDILLAGVLLLIGSPMEKIDASAEEQGTELHLVPCTEEDKTV